MSTSDADLLIQTSVKMLWLKRNYKVPLMQNKKDVIDGYNRKCYECLHSIFEKLESQKYEVVESYSLSKLIY